MADWPNSASPTPLARSIFIHGFHGTNTEAADVICEDGFKVHPRNTHWLGTGVYFYQDAPQLAWVWARWRTMREWRNKKRRSRPAVLWVTIDLRDCIDLLDRRWFGLVRDAYNDVVERYAKTGRDLPTQIGPWTAGMGSFHALDCAVMDGLFDDVRITKGWNMRSARASFWEGRPAFPTSHLIRGSNVTVVVREHTLNDVLRIRRSFSSLNELRDFFGGRHA